MHSREREIPDCVDLFFSACALLYHPDHASKIGNSMRLRNGSCFGPICRAAIWQSAHRREPVTCSCPLAPRFPTEPTGRGYGITIDSPGDLAQGNTVNGSSNTGIGFSTVGAPSTVKRNTVLGNDVTDMSDGSVDCDANTWNNKSDSGGWRVGRWSWGRVHLSRRWGQPGRRVGYLFSLPTQCLNA